MIDSTPPSLMFVDHQSNDDARSQLTINVLIIVVVGFVRQRDISRFSPDHEEPRLRGPTSNQHKKSRCIGASQALFLVFFAVNIPLGFIALLVVASLSLYDMASKITQRGCSACNESWRGWKGGISTEPSRRRKRNYRGEREEKIFKQCFIKEMR